MYWAQISENKKATNPTMKHNIDFQSVFKLKPSYILNYHKSIN